MLFTWSCHCKNLSVFIPRYFTEIDGYNLFPLRLIFISSRSIFLGDFKITCSVFSTLRGILFALNQLFKCFISRLICLFRLFTCMKKICIISKVMHIAVLNCLIEVLGQNLLVHQNQLALNQNYNHWLSQIVYDLTSKTWTSHYIRLGFHNILIFAVGFYDEQYQMPSASLQIYHNQRYLHLEINLFDIR